MKYSLEQAERLRGRFVGVTGHRKGLDQNHAYEWVLDLFRHYRPCCVVHGAALGWDRIAAKAAILLEIPTVAVIPGPWQADKWNREQQDEWVWLCEQSHSFAAQMVEDNINKAGKEAVLIGKKRQVVCLPSYKQGHIVHKLHMRNHLIVQGSHIMLALYDGRNKGGTKACIEYAKQHRGDDWVLEVHPDQLVIPQ